MVSGCLNRQVNDLLRVLEPVSQALDLLQSDWCTIGQAVAMWLELQERTQRTWAASAVRSRSEQLLSVPFSLLGYNLDPRCPFRVGPLPPLLAAQARQYAHDCGIGEEYDKYRGGLKLRRLFIPLGPNSVTKIPRPPWDPQTKFRAFSGCHFEPLQQQTPTQGK